LTKINSEHVAPCGLYCGVCRIRYATQENDLAYLERLGRIYARRFPEIAGALPEELQCDGCLSARRFPFCQECAIRDCTQRKGFQGCHQCSEFPCALIEQFPMPAGKEVMLRSIPYWRAHGTEQWIVAEEERYHCPVCGHKVFRGARQCEQCKSPVDVD
jgi:hypothetical protein